jgi:hypothetical protein
MGYDKIPEYWKMGLSDIEDLNFKYTTMSLNSVYKIGYKHALENARRNGATVKGNNIQIPVQQPEAVAFEKSFPDLYPVAKIPVTFSANKDEISFEFEGTGFVVLGDASSWEAIQIMFSILSCLLIANLWRRKTSGQLHNKEQ